MKKRAPINRSEPAPRPTDVAALPTTWPIGAAEQTDLVTRAQAGEAQALRSIAEQELPRVERLLGRILGPRRDFEDLVQNVFVELCRSLPAYRGDSKLSTFVGGITVRIARRALRPSAYERRRGPMPLELEASVEDPERATLASEKLRSLHAALDRIKPKKRIAFTLWALDGMSPHEIAEITGTKVHTVRSRIFHARHELMEDESIRRLMEDQ